MKAIFLCESDNVARVFAPEILEKISALTELDKTVYRKEDLQKNPEQFADTEYIFSTWGMTLLTEEEIRQYLPKLKCVFYAAGSVQQFARPYMNCGVKVFSAWAANAVPVAEYASAQIVLAGKGFYQVCAQTSTGLDAYLESYKLANCYPGNYGAKVGIIGAGMIGKMVIQRMQSYHLPVLVFDPFLPEEKAAQLGVTKVSLEQLFRECQVISNHLANNAQTQGMLRGAHFASMLPYATFINTGRGAQIVEEEMIQVLEQRPDLTAVLDVTFPEPPLADSPFYKLKNVFLTPHIAGSKGDEVVRMADYMATELEKYLRGEASPYEVTFKMLETMA